MYIASSVAHSRKKHCRLGKKTIVGVILRSICEPEPDSHVMILQLFSFFETQGSIKIILMKLKTQCTLNAKAVACRCSVKELFLESSQNSQENTCARVSFLIKLQALGLSGTGFFLCILENV